MMREEKNLNIKKGAIKYSKEIERTFFFYATIVMLVLYVILPLL